jgi:hypothetical protein
LAASFAGWQSESLAPRSRSSIIWRSSSNGTRSSTKAFHLALLGKNAVAQRRNI